MKFAAFIMSIILSSCSFYLDKYEVVLNGMGPGRLVVSSKDYYHEIKITSETVNLEIDKGLLYTVLFYPEFYSFECRFPLGGFIFPGDKVVSVRAEYGSVATAATKLNKSGFMFESEKIHSFLKSLEAKCDTWRFYIGDVILFLKGSITLSSIGKKRIVQIPELSDFFSWIPENRLFRYWYPSVQSFKNPDRNQFLRVEIYEDGNYNYFIYVN